MQPARLIPVSGIGSEKEAETRATSAVLAVLSVVRDLSTEIFSPLGASKAKRATVEAFIEPIYKVEKRRLRPDGLVRITFGKNVWSCFVEVKVGDSHHTPEQVNDYWDLARSEGVNHVLTISNEIAPNPAIHPLSSDLRMRSNSKVQVSHLSWTRLLTTAVKLKQHAGVDDSEQAWLLFELIRYLEHSASGALAFSDMGPSWVQVRDGAKAGTLDKRVEGIEDVVNRWDQLIFYAALKLGADTGEDVTQVLPKALQDPRVRAQKRAESLIGDGELDGVLRIPNTAGDVQICADLRGQQLVLAVELTTPEDRGARARVTWVVNQLSDAPSDLVLESYRKNARQCTSAPLGEIREDRLRALGEDPRDPARFRLVRRVPMGLGRRTGKKNPGFIDSVLDTINDFYAEVVQALTAWQPPAPRIKRPLQIHSESEQSQGHPEDIADPDLSKEFVSTSPGSLLPPDASNP